jgi:pheromone shutdown-related protein TraB
MHDTLSDNLKITIVGTAHVSEKSIREVQEVIERERPNVVAVELCPGRYNSLVSSDTPEVSAKDILVSGKVYHFLVHWLLAYVQNKIGVEVGVKPGSEMLSAIESAQSVGAQVALVDRDISITIARFWAKMSIVEKLKMLIALLDITRSSDQIELDSITDEDVISQLIEELRQFSPNAANVLVDERDAYIAGSLLRLRGEVVAVVGAGHKEGIRRYLDHPERIPPLDSINTTPKKRFSIAKITGVVFLIIICALFALLFTSGIPFNQLMLALGCWFVLHSALAATCATISKSHPLAIVTSACYAGFSPFIPLPFLKVGVIAGVIEAGKRPPTTEDFRGLTKVESVRQLFSNKLFRILIIAAFVNIGSSLATFIALLVIFPMTGVNVYDILAHAFSRVIGG